MRSVLKKYSLIITIILIFTLFFHTTAIAAISTYLVKGEAEEVYEYKLTDLLYAYNTGGLLWDDFQERMITYGVKAVYDDVSNKYVDFSALLAAYNNGINITEYTESETAVSIDRPALVQVVTVDEAGKLKFSEKYFDPDAAVLSYLNKAENVDSLRSYWENNYESIGVDLSDYNNLNNYSKNSVINDILDERPAAGYKDIDDIREIFSQKVTQSKETLETSLKAVNDATTIEAIETYIKDSSELFEIDITKLGELPEYLRIEVFEKLFNGKPFASTQELKDSFDDEVSKAIFKSPLNVINSAETVEDMEGALREHSQILGISMSKLDNLLQENKVKVLEKMIAARPFDSPEKIKKLYDDAVSSTGKNINIIYTNYPRTLKEILDIQMTRFPQTDLYGGGWQNAKREDVEYYVDTRNFFEPELINSENNYIIINVSATSYLRVREEPTSNSSELTRVYRDETYRVLDASDQGSATWYKIEARGYEGWVHGDYINFSSQTYTRAMLQFLVLSDSANVRKEDMSNILKGKGILDSMEEAFLEGSAQHSINEIFLVSLSLHETGNGSSQLAKGIAFEDVDNLFDDETVIVYNMFGIGAYDSNPTYLGAKYAYEQRWFTPEEAIIGGAKFAGANYINHATHQQNTLYKMRWNPANPGVHQYATDIGWAFKQTSRIKTLYDQLSSYTMKFDIPKYKE